MKKNSSLLVVAVAFAALTVMMAPRGVAAAPLVFNLNCLLDAHSCLTFPGSVSFGTFTFTDNGANVDIDVNIVGSSVHKIQQITFNFDDALFSNSSAFDTTDPPDAGPVKHLGVLKNENSVSAGSFFHFDLQIPDPPPGNLGTEPFHTTITLPSTNLDPENFHFFASDPSGSTSNDHKSWVGVHIGQISCAGIDCTPGTSGENSLWVGSRVVAPRVVPEPATLLLLGSGLAGLAIWRRRKAD